MPPGNRLEALNGDRTGFHSIRINDQWRLCFRYERGNAYDAEIVDYHQESAMTRLDPVHPGEVLKHDFMAPFDLSDTALARAIGVTPTRINEIVRGRRGITAETALRLARYFGTDPQSWMNLQDHYELAIAERTTADALASIEPREIA